ncbi:DUF106 domain-containing protein [Halalkalicoccus jeotgali]|uniref:HTR-like protein n=1 Tax=Halalkalicoccus jeotgali (strain DSM 18796 / CECT 7217 / JCM 14584 / KCTC 4019 / B3) TaxID=795797 RepID=D8JA16_HALJB|nr:DUF106 domain-containing protein [Halalkalicoccus jeotgali]ADJ14538.1 HTR-like protein [Halalkalicoccus jeotgali B3]ELY40110.1 HTR-like protein [Halalkalicoccus jeotgali B3]
MGRTAEKVQTLIEQNPEMERAIAVVLRESEGDGEVEWADVREDITSGQWGRLIEKGILVDGLEGFEVSDREEVASVVDAAGTGTTTANATTTNSTSADDDEESSWSKWDKMAAGGVALTFLGYAWGPARDAIGGTMNVVLGPLNAALPFYAVILVLALVTGLYSSLLQSNLMDTSKMSEYQGKMKAIQDKRERAKERGDDEAMERIQQEQMEAMGEQMGMLKEQFRPMVWIMLLTIPVFLWMYWMIGARGAEAHLQEVGGIVMPLAGQVGWTSGIVGPMQAWIVWYFVCSMAFTQILRKSLNVSTTPTG